MQTFHYEIHAYFDNHDYVLTPENTFENSEKHDALEFKNKKDVTSEFRQLNSLRLEKEWTGFQVINFCIEKTTLKNDEIIKEITAEKKIIVNT